LPSDLKDETDKEYTLYITVENPKTKDEWQFDFKVQRESYKLDVISFEFDRTASAGETLDIDVVIKNFGFHDLDDTFVKVNIPELGVSKKAYFGDLSPKNEKDKERGDDDTVVGTLKVQIPSNAAAGVYEVELEAYNADSEVSTMKELVVLGAEQQSRVFVPIKSKEVTRNTEASYSLIIVNSGDEIGVYNVIPETAEGVSVTVSEPIVTVAAGSSRTVELMVRGTSTGTKSFAVSVNQDGKVIERIPLTANVVGGGLSTGGSDNTVILTAILVIIFVVLLVVLIILLTRKPAKTEEFGESYY
jgi:uncharacterized membrane protein